MEPADVADGVRTAVISLVSNDRQSPGGTPWLIARCRSHIAISRTTGWPTLVGCGLSRLPPTANLPASTTGAGENTVTATPPHPPTRPPSGPPSRRRREHGHRHAAATRHLFNKLHGQLYHCLQHSQTFDE